MLACLATLNMSTHELRHNMIAKTTCRDTWCRTHYPPPGTTHGDTYHKQQTANHAPRPTHRSTRHQVAFPSLLRVVLKQYISSELSQHALYNTHALSFAPFPDCNQTGNENTLLFWDKARSVWDKDGNCS